MTRYRINLINKKETPLLEKIVYFCLHYLRYIIVVTQLVVIGVFFYRFQIDQKIIDLKEAVDQKKEIVTIVLPLLNEAERLDKKTKEINEILEKQNGFIGMTEYFLSIFPETSKLINLEINGDSMKVAGLSTEVNHLQAFFQVMKQDKKFNEVKIESIKKTDDGYNFLLSLDKWQK